MTGPKFMRTIKHILTVALALLAGVAQAQPVRVTDIADVAKFYAANPKAIPSEAASRDASVLDGKPGDGFTAGYAKCNPLDAAGKLLLAPRSDGRIGVYDWAAHKFLGTLAMSASKELNTIFDPTWDRNRAGWVTWHDVDWPRVMRQPWDSPSSATQVAKLPDGYVLFSNGGEADTDDKGLYYAVKRSKGGYAPATGKYQAPQCGVCDLTAGKFLEGWVDGNPNAIDIAPNGKWFAWLNHEDAAAAEPNRLYRIADLAAGEIKPVMVDSAVTTGVISGVRMPVKSLGHNGWAYLADGRCVLVYQDNRDDWMKFFDPETGKSTRICTLAAIGGVGQHIARAGRPGFALVSTYGAGLADPQICWLELATGKVTKVCSTNVKAAWTIYNPGNAYFTEGYASVDVKGENAFYAGNLAGTDNLEAYRVVLPAPGGAVPTPTPTPTPTPPPILIQGTQGGKPVSISISIQ